MKLIVGLGNIGKEYEGTRHNVGFMFLDALVKDEKIASVGENIEFHEEKKFEAEIAEANLAGEKLILVKPHTFMNLSGRAVEKIMSYFKLEATDLIVACDDIDLALGTVRVRKEGSSGGQKGLQNIIDIIGTENFDRIRIGISCDGEKVPQIETANFVLGKVSEREKPVIDESIAEAVKFIVKHLNDRVVIPGHTFSVVPKEEKLEKRP